MIRSGSRGARLHARGNKNMTYREKRMRRAKKRRFGEFARTDLACEAWDGSGGVIYDEERTAAATVGVSIMRMRIVTRAASERLGRRRGNYITTASERSFSEFDDAASSALSGIVGKELLGLCESLCGRAPGADLGVMVAGLGNADMTADAVGPETALRVPATQHLREFEVGLYEALGCSAVTVIAPGVLGQTGVESAELLRGAVRAARPDLVIAVDALAAKSCERLGRTIQLSDSGITPGSGVGNERRALTKATLGVPVISVGVPTVVDSSTLVWEALEKAGMTSADGEDELPPPLRAVLENGRSFFVSPREADVITKQAARIIAGAISGVFGVG